MERRNIDATDLAGSGAIHQLAQIAAKLVAAPVCMIEAVLEDGVVVMGRFGCDLHEYSADSYTDLIERKDPGKVVISRPMQNRIWKLHPLVQRFPATRVISITPFKLPSPARMGTLVLLDPDKNLERTGVSAILSDIVVLARQLIQRIYRDEAVRQLEERVAASQLHEYARCLASSPDSVAIFDRQMKVVSANSHLVELLQCDLADVIGKRPGELSKYFQHQLDRIARRTIETCQPQVNRIFYTPIGEAFGVFCMPLCAKVPANYFIMVAQRRRRLDRPSPTDAPAIPALLPPVASRKGELREKIDSHSVTTKFLSDTLVNKQALHQRNEVTFVSLRAWRKPIKEYQVSALSSLKSYAPDILADTIAVEIAEGARRILGAEGLRNIVPVPCHSSGRTDCLSVRIAELVAQKLGLRFCNVLSATDVPSKPGKSHPRKSARLKPFKVVGEIAGATLVVDDVATSGRHMELAFQALRREGVTLSGIVWVGPG